MNVGQSVLHFMTQFLNKLYAVIKKDLKYDEQCGEQTLCVCVFLVTLSYDFSNTLCYLLDSRSMLASSGICWSNWASYLANKILLFYCNLFFLTSSFIWSTVSGIDRCLEPMSEGFCSEYVLLWYFHQLSGECRPFVYGGCGGNQNRFSSRDECQSWCGMERGGREQITSD